MIRYQDRHEKCMIYICLQSHTIRYCYLYTLSLQIPHIAQLILRKRQNKKIVPHFDKIKWKYLNLLLTLHPRVSNYTTKTIAYLIAKTYEFE